MAKAKAKIANKKKTAKTGNAGVDSTEKNSSSANSVTANAAEFVSRNAVPLGMVAAGIGILAARTVNGGDNAVTKAAKRGRKRLAVMTKTSGRKMRKGTDKLREQAGNGVARSKQSVAAHPVAAGVAAAAVGAGLAVAVPKLINRVR